MDMNFNLSQGGHENAKDGTCALEAVSILAGEPFSDHPVCVCPVIANFVRTLNDDLPDDETRNRLLLPILPRLIGTRDSSKEIARAYLAANYAVRVFAARALQAAGVSDTLSGLAEIVDEKTAKAAAHATRVAHTATYDVAVSAADAASAATDAADYAVHNHNYAVTANCAAHAAADAVANAAHIVRAATNTIDVNMLYAKAVELVEKMIEI